ncbi:DUF3617 family protein [Ponticaulis sp.]|uniref:DUF3617 domain-containing protein n=1 Tax=Ponticaulis sp. TaxID=2020902 RepID=UPI0025F29FC4|nr:DUF3617 family protein [Ponticaulis sp.]
MRRTFTLTALIVSGLIAGTAAATEDAEISVAPGLWNWSHSTTLAGVPFSEENTECLPPDMASVSLQEMADDLNQDCVVSDIQPIQAGYSFTLTCTGFYTGEAEGTMTKLSDYQLQMDAEGQVGLAGMEADFSFSARAMRVDECPVR